MAEGNSISGSTDDSGLAALLAVARHHRIPASGPQIRHEYCISGQPLDTEGLLHAARALGLEATCISSSMTRLRSTPLPAIALGKQGEYFVISERQEGGFLIGFSGSPSATKVSELGLRTRWTGTVVLMRLVEGGCNRSEHHKGLAWFLPVVGKYRLILSKVLWVSIVLQLLGLITPLFFQVVMDEVLVNRSLNTLNVVLLGLLGVMVSESLFSVIRHVLFSHTTSQIDAQLSARLFEHLVDLPSRFFRSRKAGETAARIRELDNIRAFLTGQSLSLVLDVMFSVIFIAVMLAYSGTLTLIVVLSLPLYAIVAMLLAPMLKRCATQNVQCAADNQAFLVEVVNACDSVKTLACEPAMASRWDRQLAAYINSSVRVQILAAWGQESVALIGKLVTALTLWWGVTWVMEGALTVGQLIAFNMFAARVAQPVLRLSQLWTEFQQTAVSMTRLGEIIGEPPERSSGTGVMPLLKGTIRFEEVSVRYQPEARLALDSLSLEISAGEVVGIVGQSGSGKSTLTRLLQRTVTPESGRVLVDGTDLALVDVSSLRRQLGIVMQESFLFRGTIKANLAMSEPDTRIDRVIEAARLAGADAFIQQMPQGYDTVVDEGGKSLSGGQRQRLAIARALLTDPRILILDEATSALDPEAQQVIQDCLPRICAGRTVIMIAHRLGTVADCDRILVVEHGRLVEQGRPAELATRPTGRYAQLLQIQEGASL